MSDALGFDSLLLEGRGGGREGGREGNVPGAK